MLYPMFILVMMTMAIMVITARARMASVRDGSVSISYYSLMQGESPPEFMEKTTRHFNNLFEVPTLFYAGGAVYLAMDLTSQMPIFCAWAFVAFRIIHTFIHLGYNNVLHRLIVFGLGNISIMLLWIGILRSAS